MYANIEHRLKTLRTGQTVKERKRQREGENTKGNLRALPVNCFKNSYKDFRLLGTCGVG